MDKVYGAYLCTGCGIGEVLDVDGLKSVAAETGIAMQAHPCLCGAEGRALIESPRSPMCSRISGNPDNRGSTGRRRDPGCRCGLCDPVHRW